MEHCEQKHRCLEQDPWGQGQVGEGDEGATLPFCPDTGQQAAQTFPPPEIQISPRAQSLLYHITSTQTENY